MTSLKARIMDIERFAIKDGPGIRTVVFLQGCPLHCPWCSNPESQSFGHVLIHKESTCRRCGLCAAECTEGCILLRPGELPVFNREKCTACRRCEKACLADAIRISPSEMECSEVVDLVARDIDYYKTSGGGVTFSGGEALMQPESLVWMLGRCREMGIHTAVETCGNVSPDTFNRIVPLTDLFLFDLKHTDAETLHEHTGGDLDAILTNLRAAAADSHVRLRIPCIPGFNFDEENIHRTFSTALGMKVDGVDLLPYHKLGVDKYSGTGRPYLWEAPDADPDTLERYRKMGEDLGIETAIL